MIKEMTDRLERCLKDVAPVRISDDALIYQQGHNTYKLSLHGDADDPLSVVLVVRRLECEITRTYRTIYPASIKVDNALFHEVQFGDRQVEVRPAVRSNVSIPKNRFNIFDLKQYVEHTTRHMESFQ